MKRALFSVVVALVFMGGLGLDNPVLAASYPNKAINFIIPMEPGADGDIALRLLMRKVSEILGQTVIMINKPGAGQTVGYREIYKAQPDGYTIGGIAGSLAMVKLLGKYQYDFRDFSLIGFSHHSPPVLTASKTSKHNRFESLEDLVSFARANPRTVSMATTAVGGAYWVAAQMIVNALNIDLIQIPQEGSAAFVISAVAGGHADLGVTAFPSAKAMIDAGKIRVLGTPYEKRFPGKYNFIKTFKELGYDASMSSFTGVMGPPKMPKEIVGILSDAVGKAVNDPEVNKALIERNVIPEPMDPARFLAFCTDQERKYRAVLEKAGKLKVK